MHFVTVGTTQIMTENLWDRIAAKSGLRFSHIVHPMLVPGCWEKGPAPPNVHFFCDDGHLRLPRPDRDLLASLESDDVPTIHNMILSDRVVSKLNYGEALGYSTFLTRRLMSLYETSNPSAVIGAFDALQGSLGFAVAKKMGIPWFALNFSVIPPGFACFCDRLSPAARVRLGEHPLCDVESVAEASIEKFESRKIQAPAYLAPPPRSLAGKLEDLPDRILALYRTTRKIRQREFLKFVEYSSGHNVWAALRHYRGTARARAALAKIRTITEPPNFPYALFGLHVQPESSIDVWAPFFSNQLWVIELLARSIPPTHRLLVKIHKSDAANYSREQLDRMRSYPGVELVAPFADTRQFIDKADLLFSIQGTIGLEGALLGKPVIVLGDSPVILFPSAAPIGKISELPELVRRKLAERPPTRREILAAYREFLKPFAPAGHNDWTVRPDDREIDGYARLFAALSRHLQSGGAESIGTVASG
jgi:Capsule polysaccharide biosynthesis protein